MKRWSLVIIVLAVLSLPLLAQDNARHVRYNAIGLSYPETLAHSLLIEQIAAQPLTEPDTQFWASTAPEHLRFSFGGYQDERIFQLPLLPDLYQNQAQLMVYPRHAIQEFGFGFLDQMSRLEHLLQERPDLSAYAGASVISDAQWLPFLPWVNHAQVMRAQPSYLDWDSGSGIRFITYFDQEAAPMVDQRVFYTFQGMLGGGQYYIAALLPVQTGILPADMSALEVDWNDFAPNAERYLNESAALIEALAESAFSPTLSTLDALVQSIEIYVRGDAFIPG